MSSVFQTEITSEMSPAETFTRSINGGSQKMLSQPSGEKNCKILEQEEEECNEITYLVDSSNSPVDYSLGHRANEEALPSLNEDQMCAEIKDNEVVVVEDDDKSERFEDSSNSPENDSFETDQGDRVTSRYLTEQSQTEDGCNKVLTNVQKRSVWVSDVMESIKIELASLSDMSETEVSNNGGKFDKDCDSFQCKEESNIDDEARQECFREAALSFAYRTLLDEIPVKVKEEPEELRTSEEYWNQGLSERGIPDDDDNHDVKAEDLKYEITRDPPAAICRKPWLWPLSR